MKLDFDIMIRLHRGELNPSEAFALQARRESGAEPLNTPTAASIAPFSTMETPPPATRPVGIHAIWLAEVPKIRASTGLSRDLLDAHERMVECRSDLTDCQKNARRRILLEAWYAELGTAETPPPAATPKPVATRTGPGILR